MTTLFAGLAYQARRRFGIAAQNLHIDTTSFSVSGDYATKEEGEPVALAITYGYSRDHREDLKQWMLARASPIGADFRQGEPPFAVDQAVEGASVVPPFLGKAAFRVVD